MSTDRPTNSHGRRWAYAGAFLGGAVSIAANVGHSYVPPDDAPEDWAPHAGAVAMAVFWPVALLVAVEILARVQWPAGRRWTLLRYGGMVPVGLVAAVVSYRHMAGLLGWYGEDPLTAGIGPLAVDGLMVMATGALIATGRRTVPGRSVETLTVHPQTVHADRPPTPPETVSEDRSTDRPGTVAPEPADPPRRTPPARPGRTSPRTTKVRSIDAATDHRVDRVDRAYPDSVPSLKQIKEVLGITSQSVASTVLGRLKARRETGTKERSA